MSARHQFMMAAVALACACTLCAEPSQDATLEERLDEDRFLRGLADRGLGDLLEHYINVHGSEGVDGSLQRIARHRLQLAEPGLSTAERAAALDDMLDVRDRLISLNANDHRVATWHLDQASDAYFLLLPLDGADLTALLGIPSAAQRRRAERAARLVHDQSKAAAEDAERSAFALEAEDDFQNSYALQQLHRRLIEDERGSRIPFFSGVGAYLRAALLMSDGADRRRAMAQAADILEPQAERLSGTLASHAQLYAGLARAESGDLDRARAMFTEAEVSAGSNDRAAFAASLAAALHAPTPRRALERLDARQTDGSSLPYRMVVADALFRAASTPAAGCDAYLTMLSDRRGIDERTMRLVVLQKLSVAVAPDAALDRLPPMVTLARAMAAATSDRETAIDLYEQALSRDLDADSRAFGLLQIARLLHEAQRPTEALQRFTELAEKHPTDPVAEGAMTIAASLAEALYRQLPKHGAVRTQAGHTLSVLLDSYPTIDDIDRWQLLAARVALDDERYDDARAAAAAIDDNSSRWTAGQFLLVRSHHVEARATGAGRWNVYEDLVADADRVIPALDAHAAVLTDDSARRSLAYDRAFLRVFKAEALLALERPADAIAVLQAVELNRSLDARAIAAVLRARIDAYRADNRPADALQEVGRFLDAAPDQVAPVVTPLLAAMLDEVEQLINTGRVSEGQQRARDDVVPMASALEPWLDAHPNDPNQDALRRLVADGFRHAAMHEQALAHFDVLLQRRPNVLPFILGRAECLFSLGAERFAEAMALYKRIAAMGAESGGPAYWQSQLRMLQILDAVQKNTNRIAPRIERLRQEDATFGGDRFRRAFDGLQRKYS